MTAPDMAARKALRRLSEAVRSLSRRENDVVLFESRGPVAIAAFRELNDAQVEAKSVLDAALAEAAPAEPVSVTKLAEEFISEGSILEEENYDADTRRRMLVSFNAGFNAGRKSAAPAGTGTQVGELIERLEYLATPDQCGECVPFADRLREAATALKTLTTEQNRLMHAIAAAESTIAELRDAYKAATVERDQLRSDLADTQRGLAAREKGDRDTLAVVAKQGNELAELRKERDEWQDAAYVGKTEVERLEVALRAQLEARK